MAQNEDEEEDATTKKTIKGEVRRNDSRSGVDENHQTIISRSLNLSIKGQLKVISSAAKNVVKEGKR